MPAGSAALAEVSNATGREFAWQSRHDDGWVPTDAWKPCEVTQVESDRWHAEQSCVTAGIVVREPLLQSTASCFISPVGGVRAGFSGPTKPAGAEVAWQSTHVEGCANPPAASEECNLPGKNAPVAAPVWQASHDIEGGTLALSWNIGIGSVSGCAVRPTIDVPAYVGTSAIPSTSSAGSRAPSEGPTPPDQSPPGSVPAALKYLP